MTNEEKRQVDILHSQGIGYRKIAAETGISPYTVKSYLSRPASQTDGVCPQCGSKLAHKEHKKKKRFCSDQCRMKWWNQHRDLIKHETVYKKQCRNCGKEFETYNHPKQVFCCKECFLAYKGRDAQ